jgi:bifunctional non-homologous end joining protein LigD
MERPLRAVARDGFSGNRVPFSAAGWIFEHKLDGFRVLARKTARQVEPLSRNGRSLAVAFPEIVAALTALRVDAVLDGELIVVDQRGHPVWATMRRRAMISRRSWAIDAAKNEPATLCAFDLLACDGQDDVRTLPLLERKARLADAIAGARGAQIAGHLEAQGEALFSLGLEGIVAKLADWPYRAGRRRHGSRLRIKPMLAAKRCAFTRNAASGHAQMP